MVSHRDCGLVALRLQPRTMQRLGRGIFPARWLISSRLGLLQATGGGSTRMELEFHFLGSFEVIQGDNALRLAGRRQRALLALLAIHAGGILSVDRIADEIWGGEPPPSAGQAIRTYVSRTRKLLQTGASSHSKLDVIKHHHPGYVLDVSKESIDANRFEDKVSQAALKLAAGELTSAVRDLKDALGMWSGPTALADLDQEPFAFLESQRLAELRLQALELRMTADLGLGRHAAVIPELRDLVERFPLRERFWAQLISALYRSGRQADALAAYQRVRVHLVGELGLEPGPELRRLEHQILSQSPELEWRAHQRDGPIIASRPAGEPLPLPSRLPGLPEIGVVGRNRELERLDDILSSVVREAFSRIVLLAGDAGVGKTTLLSTFARTVHRRGAVVLYGRCDEDLVVPYGPIVEALDHYAAHQSEMLFSRLSSEHISSLARLIPMIRKSCDAHVIGDRSGDSDAERWILYGAVAQMMRLAAEQAPLVILLEDLHWADRPTLQLFSHLSSQLSGQILLVGTYRDTDLSFRDPASNVLTTLTTQPVALGSESPITRLTLGGLEEGQVATFLRASAGHAMDEDGLRLASVLHKQTGGNPLFVAEMLRHLVETRSIVRQNGRWTQVRDLSEVGLPDSLRQAIRARVDRLGGNALQILSTALVMGYEFDVGALAMSLGLDEEDVLDVIDSANSAAIVVEVPSSPGRHRFSHALVQQTLYEGLSSTRRARAHRMVAEQLEQRMGGQSPEHASELARHWLLTYDTVGRLKACHYARLAGDNALDTLAPGEAVRWYNAALEVLSVVDDTRQRGLCLVGLGEAQRQLGEAAYRETLLEAAHLARDADDVDLLVRAALANNRGWMSTVGVVDVGRIAVIQSALETLPQTDSSSRSRLLALLAMERTYDGDYASRKSLADHALAMARRLDDPSTILEVLLRRRLALRMPDTVAQLLAESDEVASLAHQLGDPVASFWNAVSRANFSVQVGNVSEVTRSHEELDRLARQIGQPLLKWDCAWQRSWSALLAGRTQEAEDLANEALHLGIETGQPDAFAIFGGQLFAIRWHQGRLNEIVDTVAGLAEQNPSVPAYRAAAAHSLFESGRSAEAQSMLDSEASGGFTTPEGYLSVIYLAEWALVASHARNRAAAETLYPRLAQWPELVTFSGITVHGAIQFNLGGLATVLQRFDDAGPHFSRALRVHQDLSAPFFVSLTELEWACMLIEAGGSSSETAAEAMLRSAIATSDRYGYQGILTRARAALEELETDG